MRIGIRSKLVVFLAAGALLPLVGALVAIISGETSVRMRSVEQSLLAVAVSEAEILQTALIGDLKQLNVTVGKPTITNALREAVGPLPFAEIQRIEESWADLAPEDRLLASVLDGPGAQALQFLRKTNSHFAEVFITNRFGELVTTTNKTSDFFQADEEWWQGAFYAGKGRVLIPQISYDISSQVWSIDLCIPIYSGSELVGIGKAVVDVGLLLGNLRQPVGMLEASILLAQENGEITYPERGVLPKLTVDEWAGEIAEGKRPGIRTTRAGELQAFVPISIAEAIVGGEVQMPRWTLVLYTRRADALSSVYRVVGGALAIGLASIAILFLAALYLFDRNIVRRVLHVAAVARRVAKGDLSSRVSPRRSRDKFLGEDEIDDLSRSFDHMISEVERSYQQLAMANELKQNFIQVAGHELRTPIAYMLGMSRLLRDNDDPSRLSEALRTIGTKAERLNRIVQALFKLMPEGVLSHELRYEEFEVAAVLEEIREEVRPFLEKRRQTLAIETPAVLPRLEADRQKIFDVLENLVMNAIKFSPDGAEVRIRVEPQDSDCLRFVVIDQGQGIAPEDLPHLFQPFFSGRHVLTHSTGEIAYQKRGMGLGLAVVRFFVELHRGTVQVATGPQGSSFSFTLPILAPSGQSTSLAYQI